MTLVRFPLIIDLAIVLFVWDEDFAYVPSNKFTLVLKRSFLGIQRASSFERPSSQVNFLFASKICFIRKWVLQSHMNII